MTMYRSVLRLASAGAATLMLTVAANAFSDEAVKDAEAMLRQFMDRAAAGEMQRTDIDKAKYFVIEMKYRAGQIQKPAYCQDAVPALQAIASGVLDEYHAGQAATDDLIAAKRRLYKVTALCRQG